MEARVALTLRTLGGLTTAEIARAFLVPEPTMAQRLVRAKRKIAAARIPYRVPGRRRAARPAGRRARRRLPRLQRGLRRGAGERLVRAELCAEAIRLGRLLAAAHARRRRGRGPAGAHAPARRPPRRPRGRRDGRYVALPDQDRARWDAARWREGRAQLDRALRLRRPGPYQLQAAIAALHGEAPRSTGRRSRRSTGGSRAWRPRRSSRSTARSRSGWPAPARRPRAARRASDLDRYQPLHAPRAELLRRSGDGEAADRAYARAIELSANAVEREELERRRGARSDDFEPRS